MSRRSRQLVAVALVATAMGCTAPTGIAPPEEVAASPSSSTHTPSIPSPSTPSPSTPSDTPTASETPTSTPSPELPVEPWEVPEHEVHLEAKRVAVDVVLALTTREAGTSLADVARRLLDDDEAAADLAAAAAPLVDPDRDTVGRVVYPQMGGLTPERASVMVVVEVEATGEDGTTETTRRTVDVRLEREGGDWRLHRLASAGGDPVGRPDDLPAVAEQVLDDPRIVLPDSARWDIHRGAVADELLQVMANLAERTPYGVVVLATGHPHDVFETGRTSSHTHGRAVDIHQVGDEYVVDGRVSETSLAHEVSRWLYEHPAVGNLGSPWALDGFGGRSFTDAVHHDHLHVAVAP